MLGISADQQEKLYQIRESMRGTHYGRYWPEEYKVFSQMWSYFNSIYNALYSDHIEWHRVAQFSIDARFQHVWLNLRKLKSLRELAKQPCVGDGRDAFRPMDRIQVAFNTLRNAYGLSVKTPCRKPKCKKRRLAGWSDCLSRTWPAMPQTITNPNQAVFAPLGATLLVVYQIRNNLFHGSKNELYGPEHERNRFLVQTSQEVIEMVLQEVEQLI